MQREISANHFLSNYILSSYLGNIHHIFAGQLKRVNTHELPASADKHPKPQQKLQSSSKKPNNSIFDSEDEGTNVNLEEIPSFNDSNVDNVVEDFPMER